jgi:hypothetical protein
MRWRRMNENRPLMLSVRPKRKFGIRGGGRGRKAFFSEEKKQKSFIFPQLQLGLAATGLSAASGQKLFAAFSRKRRPFFRMHS